MRESYLSGLLLVVSIAGAMTIPATGALAQKRPMVREIFVPKDDLDVLLESRPHHVLLPRAEYESLLEKARKSRRTLMAKGEPAPEPVVLLSAEYRATVEEQRVRIVGQLAVEVLEEGVQEAALSLGGQVSLRFAGLDDRPVAMRQTNDGFGALVEGKGIHQLTLDLVAPIETDAARQTLRFRLPRAPASRLRMTVPGDVQVQSGAAVVERIVDAAAAVTRMELILDRGDQPLVMTLNSHLQRRGRTVVARSVLIDEVTQSYERLHATVSLAIVDKPVDRFRFVVPDGFELDAVLSPHVASWAIQREGTRRIAEVRLREPTVETVVLGVQAMRTPARLDPWTLPRLELLDVVNQTAVVGLLAEARLRAEGLRPSGLVPIDVASLVKALPVEAIRGERGGAPLTAVAAYYAPQTDFTLSARLARPPAEMAVVTNALLTLEESSQRLRGGFLLCPTMEKLFGAAFSVPAGWDVTEVTMAGGRPVAFERHGAVGQPGRIEVRLPHGVPPGQECRLFFQAVAMPESWLARWNTIEVAMPVFAVEGATRDIGAIGVTATGDLAVRPGSPFHGLVPIHEPEKERYGLGGVATNLAYRYESRPYQAAFTVERTHPRLTARTHSFFRLESDAVTAHYELTYQIEGASTRELSLSLPQETPETLSLTALDGATVKESGCRTVGQRRVWKALLAQPRIGAVRLTVDFQQRLPDGGKEKANLPVVRAEGVAYQSGLLAVEGNAELDIELATDARKVDVGELAGAVYQPGRRLLGAFGFIGEPAAVSVRLARHRGYRLHEAIVQKAQLDTFVAAQGVAQSFARFELRSKAVYLDVELPEGSELWSALVDEAPAKPQRHGKSLMIGLPATPTARLRSLQVVYQTPTESLGLAGALSMPAPRLMLRATGEDKAAEVPLADLVWRLHLPTGYRVTRSNGTVAAELEPSQPAILNLAGVLGAVALWRPSDPPRIARFDAPAGKNAVDFFSRQREATVESKLSRDEAMPQLKRFKVADSPAEPTELSTESLTLDAPGKAEKQKQINGKPPAISDRFDGTPQVKPDSISGGFGGFAVSKRSSPDQRGGGVGVAVGTSASPGSGSGSGFEGNERGQRKAQVGRSQASAARQQGLSSLRIAPYQAILGQGSEVTVTFQSLGGDPRLQVSLVRADRLTTLGWALAWSLFLVGLLITRRSVRLKVRFVVWILLLGTLLPMIPGLEALLTPCNLAVYTAAILAVYYLLAGLLAWGYRTVRASWRRPAVSTMTLLLAMACTSGALAADKAAPKHADDSSEIAVHLPDDAVILPYNPKSKTGIQDAKQVFVPQEKYEELLKLARMHKKESVAKYPYGLTGTTYTASLSGDDSLLVEGRMEIEAFGDEAVTVPLHLAGGVLVRAELDRRPARLAVIRPDGGAVRGKSSSPAPLLGLHVSGKGRHRFDLAVRLHRERRGGWRVVGGTLPASAAASFVLVAPEAHTEVRLVGIADRANYETEKDGQRIETVLGPGGAIGIQWRPKVAVGQIDAGLTVRSNAVLDVQEDGLRLVCQLELEFRRGQRDAFTLTAPREYLVEKIEGPNVRGWEARPGAACQTIEVQLLKAAHERETLSLRLKRAGVVGREPLAAFDAPSVAVSGAVTTSGYLSIRRSRLLDLRTLSTSRASRVDLGTGGAAPAGAGDNDSPIPLRPFEAYRVLSADYAVRLAAAMIQSRVTAQLQTILKYADTERSLETRILLDVQERPIYSLGVRLPQEFALQNVSAPGNYHWTVTEKESAGPLLTVVLASGCQGATPILLEGKLPRRPITQPAPLPVIVVEGIDRQESQIAVQADPVFQVDAQRLQDCQPVLVGRLAGWLRPEQIASTRLALQGAGSGQAGTLRLTPREAIVACDTITNVRVADQTVEDTILLDFTIEQAGVARLEFLLPGWMRDSRMRVPALRQKTIEPMEDKPDAPVRVRLELQEEMRGTLRIQVQNDRPLTAPVYAAPIPIVKTGRTNQQFVLLQNAGRDELVVAEQSGVEPLGRRQGAGEKLRALLGDNFSQAYLVQVGESTPRLTFSLRSRAALETSKARIGLAETRLTLDGQGTYRAQQIYWMANSTEQYLEVELPPGAALWTVLVAGEPVKPSRAPDDPDFRRVRVPLVKSAKGDLDYPVVLKFGGQTPAPSWFRTTRFPLMRTRNIEVELSHVRLLVPSGRQWFDFDGTLGMISESQREADLESYRTKSVRRMVEAAQAANPYSQVRAAGNLKSWISQANEFNVSGGGRNADNLAQLGLGAQSMRELKEQVAQLDKQIAPAQPSNDNRAGIENLVETQKLTRARNVLKDLGKNWNVEAAQKAAVQSDARLNEGWLANSQMVQQPQAVTGRVEEKRKGTKQSEESSQKDDPFASVPQQGRAVSQSLLANPGLDWNDRVAPADSEKLSGGQFLEQQGQTRGRAAQRKPSEEPLRQGRYAKEPSTPHMNQAPDTTLELYKKQFEARRGENAPQSQAPGSRTTLPPSPPAIAGPAASLRAAGEFKPAPATASPAGGERKAADAAGMASLDVVLPERGTCYLFATPGGDLTLAARSIPRRALEQSAIVAVLLTSVVVLLIGGWLAGRFWERRPIGGVAFGLLVALGLFLMLLGTGIPGAFTLGMAVCLAAVAAWFRRGPDHHPSGKAD